MASSSSSASSSSTGEEVKLAMDLRKATRNYINEMLNTSSGMKVLLMDTETTGIVSMTYTQSDLTEREVFLFDLLSEPLREPMLHLKAFVFVRPTPTNISSLQKELRSPKYSY